MYEVYTVNKQFLEAKNLDTFSGPTDAPESLKKIHAAFGAGDFQQRSLEECLNDYSTTFQSSRGALLLVSTGDVNTDDAWGQYYATGGSLIFGFNWMCLTYSTLAGPPCDELINEIKAAPLDWRPDGFPLQQCYSQQTEEHCKLLFSNPLCWVVTTINLLKCILMLFVAFGDDKETPLLTVGDAVASFMQEEDTSTENMCLARKARIKKQNWDKIAVPYDAKPRRKFAAASLTRWITCISLFVFGLCCMVFGLR